MKKVYLKISGEYFSVATIRRSFWNTPVDFTQRNYPGTQACYESQLMSVKEAHQAIKQAGQNMRRDQYTVRTWYNNGRLEFFEYDAGRVDLIRTGEL